MYAFKSPQHENEYKFDVFFSLFIFYQERESWQEMVAMVSFFTEFSLLWVILNLRSIQSINRVNSKKWHDIESVITVNLDSELWGIISAPLLT